MSIITKIGKKSQIVIPKSIRDSLGIVEGNELIIDVVDDKIVIRPKPASYTKELRGLHRDVWEEVDPLEYLRRERESW
jgi:AbrB family looped-hinge helix DNA binding protein